MKKIRKRVFEGRKLISEEIILKSKQEQEVKQEQEINKKPQKKINKQPEKLKIEDVD
jgi:hypothetical protein